MSKVPSSKIQWVREYRAEHGVELHTAVEAYRKRYPHNDTETALRSVEDTSPLEDAARAAEQARQETTRLRADLQEATRKQRDAEGELITSLGRRGHAEALRIHWPTLRRILSN